MACAAPIPILVGDGCATPDGSESTSLQYSEVYDEESAKMRHCRKPVAGP